MIGLQDELPIGAIPSTPLWSENYCFDGFDPAQNVAFWIHCGRWSRDPTMWREQVLLFLPDGAYLVQRTYGARQAERGPAGANLSLICEEPAQRWRIVYHGPARRLTDNELNQAPVGEGPVTLLDIDLTFVARHPVWDFGSHQEQIWAHSHYEQPGDLSGEITFDDRRITFAGRGYRDHSRGPRDQTHLAGHCWIHGHFEDRSFAVFNVRVLEGGKPVTAYGEAVVFAGGKVLPATTSPLPYLSDIAPPPDRYALQLESELGRMELEVEIKRTLTHSVTPYFDCYNGFTPGLANIGAYQQPSLFHWNGEIAPGYTERTARL